MIVLDDEKCIDYIDYISYSLIFKEKISFDWCENITV